MSQASIADQPVPRKSIQALFDEAPWERQFTKARKPHRCDVCGLRIHKGHRYIAETIYPGVNNDNDTIETYRAHADCDVLYTIFGDQMEWWFPPDADWSVWLEILDEAGIDYPAHWGRGHDCDLSCPYAQSEEAQQ